MKLHKLVFGMLAILIIVIVGTSSDVTVSQATEKSNSRADISCYYCEALDSLQNDNISAAVMLLEKGLSVDPQGGKMVISFALSDSVSQGFRGLLASALNNYANELFRSYQIDSAVVVYQRAIQVDSTNGTFYSNLAAVKSLQGEPGKAESLREISDSLGTNCF